MMLPYLVWLRETDSTQELLRRGGFPEGTVVVADRQKKGKGRKGRRWESQEGGLYFSFVLSSEKFRSVLQVPLVVGLAVSETLDSLGVRTVIKWPNDVYARGRKIAGVLAEKTDDRVIVGVGLNVNQRCFHGELEGQAISMYQITGEEHDRVELLRGLLERITDHMELYRREGFAPFKERVEEKLIFVGEEVVVLCEKPEVGVLAGIDDEGFLLLRTAEGNVRVPAGDVSLRLCR